MLVCGRGRGRDDNANMSPDGKHVPSELVQRWKGLGAALLLCAKVMD